MDGFSDALNELCLFPMEMSGNENSCPSEFSSSKKNYVCEIEIITNPTSNLFIFFCVSSLVAKLFLHLPPVFSYFQLHRSYPPKTFIGVQRTNSDAYCILLNQPNTSVRICIVADRSAHVSLVLERLR
jgi:hypothetical protein